MQFVEMIVIKMANKYFYLNTSKEKTNYLQNWVGVYSSGNPRHGVVLHDSASGMGASAKSVAQYTIGHMDSANYHNVIDGKGNCYAVVRQDVGAYHTANADGNTYYIGVEIAETLTGGNFKNSDEKKKYKKSWVEACKLVADYLVYYKMDEVKIRQHNEFSATSCPYTMEKYFGSYEKALAETKKEVKKNIEIIKNGGKEVNEDYYYLKRLAEYKPRYASDHEKAYIVTPTHGQDRNIYLDKELQEQWGERTLHNTTHVFAYPTKNIEREDYTMHVMKYFDEQKKGFVYIKYAKIYK